jgi:hypothetical protein
MLKLLTAIASSREYGKASWAVYNIKMDDDRELPGERNPAKLLPFECEIELPTEGVDKLPFEFQGSGDEFYSGSSVF